MSALQYRREIDGLRAFAVVPVILFHAGFLSFSGGYVGVDVFFVISGYLITSIILRELDEGRFSIVRFYERRARRILPALFVVMAVSLPFGWALMMPPDFYNFTQSLAAAALSVSNILFWFESGYFEVATDLKPMLHTWSLGVEEQFYMIVPLMLLLLWRLRRGAAIWVIGGLALASLALSEWMWRVYPTANFFLLPSRAWELFAGALCAFALRGGRRFSSGIAAAAGLILIVASVFLYTSKTPFPSLYALAPVGGTALVILFAPGTAVARLLSTRPLVWIGLISYSAYLWHQPIFAFARIYLIFEPSHLVMAGLSVLTFAVAWVSWRFVEQPFRKPHRAPGRAPQEAQPGAGRGPLLATRTTLFSAAGLGCAAFVAIGLIGTLTSLQARSWQAALSSEGRRTYDLIMSTRGGTFARWQADADAESCVFLMPTDGLKNRSLRQRLQDCRARHGPGLAVIGDSHARDIFGAIALNSSAPFIIGFAQNGCRLHMPQPQCPYQGLARFAAERPQVFSSIFVSVAGFYLLKDARGREGERFLFQNVALDAPVPTYDVSVRAVNRTGAYLERLSDHADVVLLGPRPEPHVPEAYLIRQGCSAAYPLRDNQFGSYRALEEALKARLEGTDVVFVSQIDAIKLDMTRDFMTCDVFYWKDGDHMSEEGLQHFGPRIYDALISVPQIRKAEWMPQ